MAALTVGSGPYVADAREVAAAAETDLRSGLSAAEAAARLARDGPNRLAEAAAVPAWRKLLGQLADPLVYLLLGAIVISFVAWIVEGHHGTPWDTLVIAIVVVVNAVLGFVQERRSENAVAALQRMSAATALVIRDGQPVRVTADDVVVGDLLSLTEGDAVVADARLVEGSLWAAEAALTGESAPVPKDPAAVEEGAALGDRTSMVFAGTGVTRGTARAVVVATGTSTETGRIADLLEATEQSKTPLQRQIATLSKTLGIAVLVIAAVVIAAVLATHEIATLSDVVAVLLLGVALAVAAVPQALPAVMTVVLALGVQRMAQSNAIVKELSSLEALGSASVICTDKTGTLTENRMALRSVATAAGEVEATGDLGANAAARAVVSLGSLAGDAIVVDRDGGPAFEGDPTETAFLAAEHRLGLEEERHRLTRVGAVPFSSERQRMTVVASHADGGGLIAVKGAPDVILPRCSSVLGADGEAGWDADAHRSIERGMEDLAERGMRTIAVAYRHVDETPDPSEELEKDLILAGVAGIVDPPRPQARQSVADAQSAGIKIVMITGDHPATARAIATDVGIADDDALVISGPQLARMPDEELYEEAPLTAVFARVAPEDKLRLVDAFQAHGEIVAMTGDGVNDAPALRAADIGVAMGRGGTEVAREAAAMILADDDFSTIVKAIREGRGILDNIGRFLRFLIAANLGEVLSVFLGVVAAGVLGFTAADGTVVAPLLATQILWINLLTDMGPALAVSAERYSSDLMERAPRRPRDPILTGRTWVFMAWTGIWMAAATLLTLDAFLPGGLIEGSSDLDTARTAAFTVLVLANLTVAFSARSETMSVLHDLASNAWLWGAVGLSVLMQIAVVHLPVLNTAFSTAPLSLGQWAFCVAATMTVPLASEALKGVLRARERRVG
ncbi:cation-translocating P-type ATPase [Demequina zhanjiangensis]|uniref:Cation-translocating P-type ATPase n=1 Tax=Demequina zhanjiangensis TaxID=3051659 RepID=A0ABT8G499_9MICO|nr:cation-translocating P-type ATPase [Demequina sp. SYSU T00b26]MDN4473754.1 cation-translocating P-type ATPase [Demequina sp. SYSU T00b26]